MLQEAVFCLEASSRISLSLETAAELRTQKCYMLKEWLDIMGNKCFGFFFAFLPRVRRENQYHSHVCVLRIELEQGGN